jgi:hypothetical protein
MKNSLVILVMLLTLGATSCSNKSQEQVQEPEAVVVEMETDVEEVSEVDNLKADPIQ